MASLFYDAEGRRDELARDAAGAITGFSYDPISRLASLSHDLDGAGTANDATFGFGYNPASQITTRSLTNNAYEYPVSSSTRTYAVNGRNQYTQVGGTTHSWDANGNLTSDGATSFGYDTENRLTSASGAKNASLTYDPLGRLFEVTSGANTTRFVYDGDRLIAEYSGSGTLLRRYVHGPGIDEPLVWYEGSSVSSATRRYLHADHQGSIVATSNASGAKLQVHAYDAYGITPATNTLRFQYTGQAAILELGLLYYKARFYNPALGRFMQTDPIGYEDDLNLYAYVGNDPLNSTDPTGTEDAAISLWSACLHTGGSNCGSTPLDRDGLGDVLPFGSALTEIDQGNYKAAMALAALDVGTGGKGKLIGSLGSTLGRNLAAVGRGALKGLEEAHHIVAQGANNRFAIGARAILQKVGIGIHDAVNGVALPEAFHQGLHTLRNYRSVFNRLNTAFKSGGADAVRAELGKIGAEAREAAIKAACAAPTGTRITKC